MQDQKNSNSQYREKLVRVLRTSKVVKGGRIFSFLAIVVVGDENGRVGLGTGKAREVPAAIAKAVEVAKRSMHTIKLVRGTIRHAIVGRHGATRVFMRPASEGTGVIAGGAMRAIFDVLGVKNILSKRMGSANAMNVILATLDGLNKLLDPQEVAKRRGKSVHEILGRTTEKDAA